MSGVVAVLTLTAVVAGQAVPARMFTFSLAPPLPVAAVVSPAVPTPPAELHAAALYDLTGLVAAGADPRNVRYLSLHGVAAAERDDFFRALKYALRKTKWRQADYHPVRFYSGLLVRLDLAALGWDRAQRSRRIALLRGEGVDVSTFHEDFWELLATADPYWFTSSGYGPGYRRGWLDPGIDARLRALTYASKAVLSAHQVLPLLLSDDTRTSKERPFGRGGIYSQALLIPPKEIDLHRALGVSDRLVDGDALLRSGAAVAASYVAKANREIQFRPSSYPWGGGFLAETFDFKGGTDGDAAKNVFESLVGTARHDGREVYFTKPDGDLGTALYDAAGNQVAFVPAEIAVDQREGVADREKSVVNTYKCISCHDAFDGVIPVADKLGPLAVGRRSAVKAYSYSHERLTELLADAEDYYLSDLPGRVNAFRAGYAARSRACNGLSPAANAQLIVRYVEAYNLDLVTPAQAAREAGYDLPTARLLWRTARRYSVDRNGYKVVQESPQLVALYAGQPVRRAAWERAYADFLRADVYPWEYAGLEYCCAFQHVPWFGPPSEGKRP